MVHLDAERQRDEAILTERQSSLQAAFDADLDGQQTLDAPWVRDATAAYIAAREALLLHDLAVQHERDQRAANLQAAAEAQDRAIGLLELQDGLWRALPWPDLSPGTPHRTFQEPSRP